MGQPKATVAAERINARVQGVRVTPHFGRIEDQPAEWYRSFSIIILGLDSLEVRPGVRPDWYSAHLGFLNPDARVSSWRLRRISAEAVSGACSLYSGLAAGRLDSICQRWQAYVP